MNDVYYQETLVSPRAAADCLEAAGTALLGMGSRPVVQGWRVSADLGSLLKTRGPQMLFCPLSWLPIAVTVDIGEAGGKRLVLVGAGDRLPFAPIILGRGRYKRRCQEVVLQLLTEIDAQLSSTDQS